MQAPAPLRDPLSHLPFEISISILSHLPNMCELQNASLVCKYWHVLASGIYLQKKKKVIQIKIKKKK